MRVLIMAGGTGGHVFPALAAAEELRREGCEIAWMGTRRGLEARLVPAAGIPIHWIGVGGLRGKGWRTRLGAPLALGRALSGALAIVRKLRPAVALGMGGFASGPGGLAAWLTRRPLVIHEQNAVPGLTNRVLARFATTVLEGFPGSFPPGRGARCVGNPVRADVIALPPPAERFAGRTGRARLLVFGGSQGAAILNATLPEALAALPPESRPEVWHQAGERHLDIARVAYAEAGVEVRLEAFVDDVAAAYAWADLAVCRAGALTVAELAAAGLGAVLVPFAAAVDDHQTRNAAHLADRGAAVIMAQKTLTAEALAETLRVLCADRARLERMAEAARTLARPDAARELAQACLDAAREAV
ncbi:MAG TPA: undecaprenyldiphospho-muramoylpentapeptide beta-N-acetylglucosaminyltransferase [Gammaproteobacteria bacterium]|nr:undecaprenyldiphospho-muramoylpentapeptide beta-N-acetylglucosaminyltransferase [Gammaproteobacteria bacterium]HET7586607.1 undecaprenyldiphospho-muramoylpentapeptide beta-N-acetylglucosaminyltransferase [Gammaproteobacteria bacterium]